ncbi:hypothetical protein NN561_002818 [Cricetulus griseus]
MRHSERALGRGPAPTAASDWRCKDLPAALQGGAKQAIFRGLYKGAEAAAEQPGSSSAPGRAAATLALAPGTPGQPVSAALWPPTLADGLSRAVGVRTPCGSEKRVAAAADREMRSPVLGWDASCGSSRLSGGASVWGKWLFAHSVSTPSMGKRAARERPSSGQHHIPKSLSLIKLGRYSARVLWSSAWPKTAKRYSYLKPRAEEERRVAAEEKKRLDELKRIERELAEGDTILK